MRLPKPLRSPAIASPNLVIGSNMEPLLFVSAGAYPALVVSMEDYSKEPATLVEFILEKTTKGTLLRIIESGFDMLPRKRRDEAFRMNSEGWSTQIVNITHHVEE